MKALDSFTPSVRQAEDRSMSRLRGFRPSARKIEDSSMGRHDALQAALSTIRAGEARKTDPYNSLVYGRGTPTHANLTDMTIAEVLDYQKGMRRAGHASTALGAYQTLRGTLQEAVRRTGIDPNKTKFSKAVQDQIAIDLIDNRARQAMREGKVDAQAFADQLANEWAAFANSSGQSAYEGDSVGNTANTSHETVRGIAQALVDTGAVGTGPARTAPAQSPNLRPAEGAQVAATDEPDPLDSIPEVFRDTWKQMRDGPQPRRAARDDRSPPKRFEQTYLNLPETAPTPSPRPQQDAPVERSLPQRIAAGAIDIGGGMLPGFGAAIGVGNMAAQMTGRRTLGQRIVDDFVSGKGRVSEDMFQASESEDRPLLRRVAAAEKEDPVERFEDRYLAPFKDDTDRPTPAEKWGDRSAYVDREYA